MNFFKVAGVARKGLTLSVRYANTLDRVRVLERSGFKDIGLIELPSPMSKIEAVQYLLHSTFDQGDDEIRQAMFYEMEKLRLKSGELKLKKGQVVLASTKEPEQIA
jgi:hypothetical protein